MIGVGPGRIAPKGTWESIHSEWFIRYLAWQRIGMNTATESLDAEMRRIQDEDILINGDDR